MFVLSCQDGGCLAYHLACAGECHRIHCTNFVVVPPKMMNAAAAIRFHGCHVSPCVTVPSMICSNVLEMVGLPPGNMRCVSLCHGCFDACM